MQQPETSVIVVGGGASAVYATFALLDRARVIGLPAPRVTVVGREPIVGRGLAYGRAEPHHRLNSPAGKMSLSATDDAGFLRWLDETGWRDVDGTAAGAASFVPRRVFGDYLESWFASILRDPDAAVSFVHGTVVDVVPGAGPVEVVLDDGRVLGADDVVLALGNPTPAPLPSAATRSVDDPWAQGALDGIDAGERVLLIGTGLTMIDVATSLARGLPGVRLTATSRRLLLPAVHLAQPAAPGPGLGERVATLGEMISAYGAQLRAATRAGSPWQAVLDGLRPQTQALWLSLSVDDRRRFVEHVSRRWDVHRHRMAPAVWAELSGLIESGRLAVEADVDASAFDVAINCTGPASVASRGWNALVDRLLDAGVVVPDATGLGFEADASGALVTAAGDVSPHLFTLGAALKGALWETVAIGEVRQIAYRIAARLTAPAPTRLASRAGLRVTAYRDAIPGA